MAAQCKLQGHYDKVVDYLENAIALRDTQDLGGFKRGLHRGQHNGSHFRDQGNLIIITVYVSGGQMICELCGGES
jgi:hypothetical protein